MLPMGPNSPHHYASTSTVANTAQSLAAAIDRHTLCDNNTMEPLETIYECHGWDTSKARRFYLEEWQRMDPGTAHKRPPYPYTEIIKVAILKSPNRRLTLSQLYFDCNSKFPYFANNDSTDSWKNTLRHNLSTQRYFVKLNREVSQPGKGHYWTYDAQIELAGMSTRRRRQFGTTQPYGLTVPGPMGEEDLLRLRPRTEPSSPIHPGGLAHRGSIAGPYPAAVEVRRRRSSSLSWQEELFRRRLSFLGPSTDTARWDQGRQLPCLETLPMLPLDHPSSPLTPIRSLSDHFLSHPIGKRSNAVSYASRRRGTR